MNARNPPTTSGKSTSSAHKGSTLPFLFGIDADELVTPSQYIPLVPSGHEQGKAMKSGTTKTVPFLGVVVVVAVVSISCGTAISPTSFNLVAFGNDAFVALIPHTPPL